MEYLVTVFTRKSVYTQKSTSLELGSIPLPFDVKYLMNGSLEWALLFSLRWGAFGNYIKEFYNS